MKLRILRVALKKQDYVLAAHAIVYGMVKTKIQENKENGKKGSPPAQPKRS